MTTISHAQAREMIHTALDQRSTEFPAELQAHLDACATCRTFAQDLGGLAHDLRRVLHTGLDPLASRPSPLALTPQALRSALHRSSRRVRQSSYNWAGAVGLALLLLGLFATLNWLLPRPAALPAALSSHTPDSQLASTPAVDAAYISTATLETTPASTPPVIMSTPGPDWSGEPVAVYSRYLVQNWDIFLLDNTGKSTNLTHDPAEDKWPVWSPNGTKIAFYSDRTGVHELYVLDLNTLQVQQLTQTPEDQGWLGAPVWSPDGSQLVALHVTGVTERSEQGVTFKAAQLYTIRVDGSGTAQVTEDMRPGLIGSIHWSPDGQWIAFTRDTESGGDELRLIHPDGSGLVELVETPSRIWELAWAPDSQQVAYLTQGPWVTTNNSYVLAEDATSQLWLQGLDGSEPVLLADIQPASVGLAGLLWSSDQARLYFLFNENNSECWLLDTVYIIPTRMRTRFPRCLSPIRGVPILDTISHLLLPQGIGGDGYDFNLVRLDPAQSSVAPQVITQVRLLEGESLVIRPQLDPSRLPAPPPSTPVAELTLLPSQPGILQSQSPEVCQAMQTELEARLLLPVALEQSAPFTLEDGHPLLPGDHGLACKLSAQGPMHFDDLQAVFDAITPLILRNGYYPDSTVTAFRSWQGLYTQADLRLLLQAEWQPLDAQACPDQDRAADCPLPAEQKELVLTLYMARDPLMADIQFTLNKVIQPWKAADAAALEFLSPALRAQLPDLPALSAALGVPAPDHQVYYEFELRQVTGQDVSVYLTLYRREGAERIWLSDRMLTLITMDGGWRIQTIEPVE